MVLLRKIACYNEAAKSLPFWNKYIGCQLIIELTLNQTLSYLSNS